MANSQPGAGILWKILLLVVFLGHYPPRIVSFFIFFCLKLWSHCAILKPGNISSSLFTLCSINAFQTCPFSKPFTLYSINSNRGQKQATQKEVAAPVWRSAGMLQHARHIVPDMHIKLNTLPKVCHLVVVCDHNKHGVFSGLIRLSKTDGSDHVFLQEGIWHRPHLESLYLFPSHRWKGGIWSESSAFHYKQNWALPLFHSFDHSFLQKTYGRSGRRCHSAKSNESLAEVQHQGKPKDGNFTHFLSQHV